MRNLLRVMGLLFLAAAINACYWDNPPEPVPIDPSVVSFDTHVMPIFNSACNTTDCHDGSYEPNLLADEAWRSLHSGGYVNLTFPEESILYQQVDRNLMPPIGRLSETEIEIILAWIRKGAYND